MVLCSLCNGLGRRLRQYCGQPLHQLRIFYPNLKPPRSGQALGCVIVVFIEKKERNLRDRYVSESINVLAQFAPEFRNRYGQFFLIDRRHNFGAQLFDAIIVLCCHSSLCMVSNKTSIQWTL
jgi:hypothetical protein